MADRRLEEPWRAMMDARNAVETAQAGSEATRDEPIPERAPAGRPVVQSVRPPAEESADPRMGAGRARR